MTQAWGYLGETRGHPWSLLSALSLVAVGARVVLERDVSHLTVSERIIFNKAPKRRWAYYKTEALTDLWLLREGGRIRGRTVREFGMAILSG